MCAAHVNLLIGLGEIVIRIKFLTEILDIPHEIRYREMRLSVGVQGMSLFSGGLRDVCRYICWD